MRRIGKRSFSLSKFPFTIANQSQPFCLSSLRSLRSGASGSLGPKSLCAESVLSTLSVLSIRPKDESAQEKLERKQLLKAYRRERRVERKANTQAFKDEKKEQERNHINNRRNLQGKSIV